MKRIKLGFVDDRGWVHR